MLTQEDEEVLWWLLQRNAAAAAAAAAAAPAGMPAGLDDLEPEEGGLGAGARPGAAPELTSHRQGAGMPWGLCTVLSRCLVGPR